MQSSTYFRRLWLLAILIAVVSAGAYLPALGYDFVSLDDYKYIRDNPFLTSPNSFFLKWMFTTFYFVNWHPLTWFSYSLDYAFWGLNPMGYHLTNILLHTLNTLIVFLFASWLFRKTLGVLNGKGLFMAVFVGVIFGLHPLHVESVVWVSERKDVLYAFFWLLSLFAYVKYVTIKTFKKKALYYVLCLISFGFSLMSKPMAVTLPLVLLLLDWYPQGRVGLNKEFIKITVIEKFPFYIMSLLCSVLTVKAQGSGGAIVTEEFLTQSFRFWLSIKAVAFYLLKTFVPVNLTPFYPLLGNVNPFSLEYLGSLILVLGVTFACIAFVKRIPVLMAAWAYFVITLLPVLGLVKVGFIVGADRYMYLPILGPLMLLGLSASQVWDVRKLRGYLVASTFILAILLSAMTVMQGRIWRDSLTLRYHIAMNVPKRPKPYADSAIEHLRAGRYESAVKDLTEAISLVSGPWGLKFEPELHTYYNNRGNAYFALKQYEKAAEDYGMAISYEPEEAEYYYNQALAYGKLDMLDRAISGYRNAVSLNPDFAPAYNNMGNAYAKTGDYEKAIKNLNIALSLEVERGDYYYNRGRVLEAAGNKDQALRDYQNASRLGYEAATERLGSLGAAQ